MTRVRLGAVGYLNARPLVFGLGGSTFDVARVDPALREGAKRFDLRFDVPSKCADLLHKGDIDVGLIPSIEYLEPPVEGPDRREDSRQPGEYLIVPGLAIVSNGPVASVALYATRPMPDVRSIALDTSSRTSVALVRVLCARHFRIDPALESRGPHLESMLKACDAALIIGDNALFQSSVVGRQSAIPVASPGQQSAVGGLQAAVESLQSALAGGHPPVEKIDLGQVWTETTGLPFVWAFWAGRRDALTDSEIEVLQQARDAGVRELDLIAHEYFAASPDAAERRRIGARYLRDNIQYHLGPDEQAGLELFYEYAVELGIARAESLRFFGKP
jgi:chorismate dehydratase